jgi:hypothetical protein
MRTSKAYSDREMEFEAHYIYPADGRILSEAEQKQVLDASTDALNAYIQDNTTSFKPSWGSKMERASAAARKMGNALNKKFNAVNDNGTNTADIHPSLELQQHPDELLQNNIGGLYSMSQKIDSPVCENNSADWIKQRRIRAEFVEPKNKQA